MDRAAPNAPVPFRSVRVQRSVVPADIPIRIEKPAQAAVLLCAREQGVVAQHTEGAQAYIVEQVRMFTKATDHPLARRDLLRQKDQEDVEPALADEDELRIDV